MVVQTDEEFLLANIYIRRKILNGSIEKTIGYGVGCQSLTKAWKNVPDALADIFRWENILLIPPIRYF
jgi:hypothetical protein